MTKRVLALSPANAETNLRVADRGLYRLATSFEILEKLRWDVSIRKKFLDDWHAGRPCLPIVKYPKYKFSAQNETLKNIIKRAPAGHPLAQIVKETAESYQITMAMLENLGRKPFMRYSEQLFGLPTDAITHRGVSTLKAAEHFLRAFKKFKLAKIVPAEDICILAEYVATRIRKKAERVFKDTKIQVVTDPKLFSKAAASPERIRVRSSTCFALYDIQQLIQHELMVHILTIQNGRKQPYRCLGLNSPRTTCTQEGLAVFAEFITGSIDVSRLQRISARVKAIQMGIDGANFIEVFQYFLGQGQSEDESYNSTARIFRGGTVKGGVVFTKDLTYLKGFVEIHRFLLRALQNENYLFPHYIFAGRMRTNDVVNLKPLFEDKTLRMPVYEPDWVKNRSTLLAFLVSSNVMNNLGLSKID